MSNAATKRGFTIIEVVLVLAIAGLIFLMVFIALPSLQRSQRDGARQQEVSTVLAAIGTYSSANNGRLPSNAAQVVKIVGAEGDASPANTKLESSGHTVALVSGFTGNVTGKEDGERTNSSIPLDTIVIYTVAKCGSNDGSGSLTIDRGSSRQAAVVTFLESGLMYCEES